MSAKSYTDKSELLKKQADFFLKDYELKIRYLTDHFSRMWTRFNFFLTVESGILGGKVIVGKGPLNDEVFIILLGISFLWYLFGAQDRYLVVLYRRHVAEAAEQVAKSLGIDTYRFVGSEPRSLIQVQSPAQWYIRPFSITKMAAIVPGLLIFTWTAALIIP